MRSTFDVIVVIPIGPGSSIEFIADTIYSFIHYTRSVYKIVLADDSNEGIGAAISKIFPDCDIVLSQKAKLGGWAGLYINLSLAYAHAVSRYRFKALLKLDTDALVIGPEPEAEAIQLFNTTPLVGIAGQYPLDYHGHAWDLEWPRRRILNGTRTWKFFRRPAANWALNKLYNKALKNGYTTGESVFGGAYFMNESFLIQLFESGLLPYHRFKTLNLGEDHLFSLLAKGTGFQLGNLSAKGLPFGCAWKGLPASPQQLVDDNKKIIHSVRCWNEIKEGEIRSWFRNKRAQLHAAFITNNMA